MTHKPDFDPSPKTLAVRSSGTAEVVLLWSRRTGRAAVAVEDPASGDYFELLVGSRDNALDLFEHPYAYAATRLAHAA